MADLCYYYTRQSNVPSYMYLATIFYTELEEDRTIHPLSQHPAYYDRHPTFSQPYAIENVPVTHIKTLLILLFVILICWICVSIIGIVWFGPRWPTYDITYDIAYTLPSFLLKIGIPLPPILLTLSILATLVIGICTYLCFGNP